MLSLKLESHCSASARGPPPLQLITTLLICTLLSTSNASYGPVTCPGLGIESSSLACTASCQQATCSALSSFFSSTYNATTPHLKSWRHKEGWETALNHDCARIVANPTADGAPTYCSWHGVTCCNRLLLSMRLCTTLNSLIRIKIEVNGLNGSVSDPKFEQSIAQLHACGLMSLELAGNALSGTLSSFWGDLRNLTALNLGKNLIHGTIPDALRKLNKLMMLQLDRNLMHGTIPHWLSELQSLQSLSLSAFAGRNPDGSRGLIGTIPDSLGDLQNLILLSLDSNSLTGPLPSRLCHRNLIVLILRSNQITGSVADLLNCSGLRYLDIHGNNFTGRLPDIYSWGYKSMMWLDLSNNNIEGTLPMALYRLETVGSINLSRNRLNGSIHSAISQMPYLVVIDLHSNQLTGTIDESVWYMPRLGTLDLSGNKLTGTLSPAIGVSHYLSSVLLDNNQLTGHIPPEIGLLPSLASVDVRKNLFSCSGGSSNTTGAQRCSTYKQLLPCFLKLGNHTVPLADASNMECPTIERKNRDEAVRDCLGSEANQLGEQAASIPADDQRAQLWYFDPAYFHYQGCKCLGGFTEKWSGNHTVLTCEVSASTLPPWLIPLAAVLFAVGVLLFAAAGLLVWLKLTVQLRRKWQREKELNNNRLKGAPNGGPAAIVVTDVEKYSELMQLNAAVTTKALGIHNAILRKAVMIHAGHVIEQEGDSWSVAFHRPVDAVAFCLQVQQMLQKSHWPTDLKGLLSARSAVDTHTVSASAPSWSSTVTAEVVIKQQARQSEDMTSIVPEMQKPVKSHSSSTTPSKPSGLPVVGSTVARVSALVQKLVGRTPEDTSDSVCAAQMNVRHGLHGKHSSQPAAATDSDTMSSITMSSKATTGSAMRAKHMKTSNGEVLGLKVRMGIASGWVPEGSEITTSAVFALAKGVSEMANGGQILLDSRTADAVRTWLSDLGCVDHKGYNDKLLSTSHNQAAGSNKNAFARWLLSLLSCALKMTIVERDPLLFDMGQFWVPSLSSTMHAVSTALSVSASASSTQRQAGTQRRSAGSVSVDAVLPDSATHCLFGSTVQASGKAAIAVAAHALVCRQRVAGICAAANIHLYSIVAQPLLLRSKIWRNDLTLKQDTQQLTKGYFQAPGTLLAALGTSATAFLNVDRPLLPPVTMVFAAVEDGRMLVRKKEHEAFIVHNVMSRMLQALLLSFPDGYLCSEQEAVLKYMVAFREPARAAEWCLLVQEVLQYIPWPAEVMEAFNGRTQSTSIAGGTRTSATGRYKRPGLKMGLAEGEPDSITPDHLGHADYLGTSVNLAARIMDTAAKSGHVVMSCELAQSIFSSWRYEAELSGHTAIEVDVPADNNWQQFTSSCTEESKAADARDGLVAAPALNTVMMPEQLQLLPAETKEQSTSCQSHVTGTARLPADLLGAGPGICRARLSTASADNEQHSIRVVRVGAHHIGTYAFKGCGALNLVCLSSDAITTLVEPHTAMAPSGAKGVLIMAAAGPVLGMQDYPVALPNILPDLKEAWGSLKLHSSVTHRGTSS